MTLPELAVRRPVAVSMMLTCLLVLGIVALLRLELAFMPDSQRYELYVVVDYNNSSPKATEKLIVRPLEDALSSINGIVHMWSASDSRGARINLEFDIQVDMALVRAEIHERIDRTRDELPDDLERIVISENWNPRESGETILEARISSGRDLSKNYELLDRKIVRPLERIQGVAVVSLDGVNPREVRINLHLEQLKRHGFNAQQIWQHIRENSENYSVGMLRSEQNIKSLRVIGAFDSVEQIGRLNLPNSELVLEDVATITFQEPPLEYGRRLDGEFAIGLNVAKESSANTINITDEVKRLLANMKDDPELDGINFLVWQDQGKEIRNTLNDLEQTGFFGAILASLVLFIFLRKFSTTLVAVSCIPFALIVTCGVIWLQGKSLNTISLLGLIVGLGMLVDNAVVIMENIDRYQKKGYGGRVAAILGAKEVSVAVITATLTSLIVFLPMIFSKPTGFNIILRELGLTICITLVASLLVSQTLIPLASRRLLKKDKKPSKTPVMSFLQKHYGRIMLFTLRYKWLALVVGLGILGTTWFPFNNINFNFDDAETQMFIGIRLEFSEALPLEIKEDYVEIVEAALEPHKEAFNVDSIYSYWSENFTTTRLYMEQGYQNEDAMNVVRKQLPQLLPTIAGLKLQVLDNVPFWKRNSGKRVAIQLQGPDSETLGKLGEEAIARIESIPGLFDFYSTAEGGQLEIHAQLDRNRIETYGVSPNEPANLVEMTFRGRSLPRFQSEDSEVETRLMLGEESDTTLTDLMNLSVETSDERALIMDNIANFTTEKGPNRINRQNKISSIWVGAKFDQGKRGDYQKKVLQALKSMPLPDGYRWESRSFRNQDADNSQQEFILNLIMALGLIFAVMASLFESIRQAIALTVSLPFAVAGAIWSLYLFQIDFDKPAAVALLLLLGIVVNNGIVMIEHINMYRRQGWNREKAMLQGGKERLRPIIMTALTTLVGLIPIMIQKPSLGGIYYYSMAYVLVGGLIISTFMTTILLPATIAFVEDSLDFKARLFRKIKNKAEVAKV